MSPENWLAKRLSKNKPSTRMAIWRSARSAVTRTRRRRIAMPAAMGSTSSTAGTTPTSVDSSRKMLCGYSTVNFGGMSTSV
jgi:hypothetical protein